MNAIAIWRRAVANLFALGALAMLLSACMLTSEKDLIADTGTATPLPASFTMHTYSDKEGAFAPSEEAGTVFRLAGQGYVSGDDAMTVHFAPLDDGRYLMSVGSADGVLYGIARFADNILEIRMIFATEPDAAIDAARSGASPDAIAGLTVAEGGVTVTNRAALDFVVGLMASGELATAPLVAFVAEGGTERPATIAVDGDWYKATT